MRYLPAAAVLLILLLYRRRRKLGLKIARAKLGRGYYDSALRWVSRSSFGNSDVRALHQAGLILDLAGRLAEAERRYRTALAVLHDGSAYPRERLHTSLGSALVDLGRYAEAEECFERAIQLGDQTGISEDGLAEVRLAQGVEADKALAYVRRAIELWKWRKGRVHWIFYANQARALALLGRAEEARQSLARALGEAEPGAPETADLHWRAGMALLALQQHEEAREHFRIGRDADPRGKYGRRCAELFNKAA